MTMRIPQSLAGRRRAVQASARFLGLFSVGLGLAELLAPRSMARALGLRDAEDTIALYGAREIITGIGILASGKSAPWVWGRVAGDALDLASLGAGLSSSERKLAAVGAIGAVSGVTLADFATAKILDELDEKDGRQYRDYTDRSGFPRKAAPRARSGVQPDPSRPQPGIRV
ncbi:MAG: hypothetical protein JO035_07765 [Betaproteobacteria bacterium]|nr:hypothetical protein [Betaproteobacteria bacterium]